jgi:hypothetical protein
MLKLRRQDEEHFGGLREAVLERDQYRCCVCDAPGRSKRSIIVHHRVPGRSVLHLMISLCPGCHAKVHRTRVVFSAIASFAAEPMERAAPGWPRTAGSRFPKEGRADPADVDVRSASVTTRFEADLGTTTVANTLITHALRTREHPTLDEDSSC